MAKLKCFFLVINNRLHYQNNLSPYLEDGLDLCILVMSNQTRFGSQEVRQNQEKNPLNSNIVLNLNEVYMSQIFLHWDKVLCKEGRFSQPSPPIANDFVRFGRRTTHLLKPLSWTCLDKGLVQTWTGHRTRWAFARGTRATGPHVLTGPNLQPANICQLSLEPGLVT